MWHCLLVSGAFKAHMKFAIGFCSCSSNTVNEYVHMIYKAGLNKGQDWLAHGVCQDLSVLKSGVWLHNS